MAEHEHEMDVYRLDLSTKKWKLLCEARGLHVNTTQSFKHEVAYYNNKIYMFGGVYFSSPINTPIRYINIFQVSCVLYEGFFLNYFLIPLLYSRKYMFSIYHLIRGSIFKHCPIAKMHLLVTL